MLKRLHTIAVLLCVVVLCIPVVVAGAPAGPQTTGTTIPAPRLGMIRLTTLDPYDFAVPAVAYNSTRNEYLAVWHMPYDANNIPGIFAARFDSQGSIQGMIMTISADSQSQTRPDVAYDSVYDQYMIVWQDKVGSNWNIRGRIIDATQINPGAHEFYMAYDVNRNMLHPSIAFDPKTHVFMTTWTEVRSTGTGICAQRYEHGAATPVDQNNWIDVSFDVSGTNDRTSSDIAWDKTNDEFIIVYQRSYSPTDEDLAMVVLNPAGAIQTVEFTIAEATDIDEIDPAIAICPHNNEVLVLWQETSGLYGQIKGRFIDAQAQTWGDAVEIGMTPMVDNQLPEIACNHNGNAYMATWWEYDAFTGYSAYARTIKPNGATSATATIASPALTGSYVPMAPIAIAGGTTNFVVAWENTVDFFGMTTSKILVTTLTPYQSYIPLTMKSVYTH